MPRWLLALFVSTLCAQRFESGFYHRNSWQFPPLNGSIFAQQVVTSSDGQVFVGSADGLHRLEWTQFVAVEGLPREKVVHLQRLASGEIAVQFQSGSFATNGRQHKPLAKMPERHPQSGRFDWDGFKIDLEPGKHLAVHRKSDHKLLFEVTGFPPGTENFWYPAKDGKAFFLLGDTWAYVDSRTATYELMQFVLPNKILDLYFDPETSKLYLALGPKGIAIASLDPVSGTWEIPNETSVIQPLHQRPGVMQARGASILSSAPIPWFADSRVFMTSARPTEAVVPVPGYEFDELQQILITAKGTRYAIPRLALPKVKIGSQWREVPFAANDPRPLPVRWLAQADDGSLWAAGKHGLIQILNPDSTAPILKRTEGEFGNAYISEFQRDAANRLVILGEGWFAAYESGVWTKTNVPPCSLSPRLRSIAFRNSNEYWIAYRNGAPVTRVQLSPSPTCFHYGKDNGNPNEETNDLEFDRDGWLWMLGSSATVVLTQPDRVDKALLFPQYVYFPSGSGHWHGFLDEPSEANILIGRYLTRIRRSYVQVLAALEPRLTLVANSPTSYRFSSDRPMPPEISYSILWRWVSSDGKSISEFAPMRIIEDESRPRDATAIEVVTPAGRQMIPYPIYSNVRIVLGALAVLLLCLIPAYRYRWHLRLLWRTPKNRQAVERALFLQLRSADPEARDQMLLRMPASVRPTLRIMLDQFERISDGEDDRTRSGLILDQKYLLEHVIAKGGFATVYLAQDTQSGATVAVKLFQQPAREGSWLAKRLALEIEALRRIDHPGVVKLIHHGTTPDARPFLVMDFIQGVTLRQLLRQGPIDPDRAKRIVEQITTALIAVHAQGILHRDIKPENIVISNAGTPNERALMIDFGVATVYDEILDGRQSTFFAGSLDYSAPEQVAGLRLETSDVYSLGVLAFEVFTGDRFKQVIGPIGRQHEIEEELVRAGWPNPSSLAQLLFDATTVEHSRRVPTAQCFIDQLRA